MVRAATERADRLVDSLLLLARSDRLSVDGLPVTERVELSAVTAAGLAAVRAEVEARGLRLDVAWGPAPVRGDPGLLERLAGNLVENAVRHNVDGGGVHADDRARRRRGGRTSWWPTPAPSCRPRRSSSCSSRSGGTAPRAPPAAAPGWAWRSCAAWRGCTAARSHAVPREGGGLVVRVELPAAGPAPRPAASPVRATSA